MRWELDLNAAGAVSADFIGNGLLDGRATSPKLRDEVERYLETHSSSPARSLFFRWIECRARFAKRAHAYAAPIKNDARVGISYVLHQCTVVTTSITSRICYTLFQIQMIPLDA